MVCFRGERKWLQHICTRCWVESQTASRHTEFSKECPLASHKNPLPSTTDTTTPWLRPGSPVQDYDDHLSDFGSVCEFHVLEFHLDSRLNLVSQDSRLCVQDQFFLDPNLHGMDTLLSKVIGLSQDSRHRYFLDIFYSFFEISSEQKSEYLDTNWCNKHSFLSACCSIHQPNNMWDWFQQKAF